jgi:hypothetical protein
MRFSRVLLLGAALHLGLNAPLHGQFPDGAIRMIQVSGKPTRVLTLGLDARTEGAPILFLHAGGGVTLTARRYGTG